MPDQKLENLLNTALEATPREREKSLELNVGYDAVDQRWEVIVKYSGDIRYLEGRGIQVTELLGGYAILTLSESLIDGLADLPEIEYVEKPKRLFFSVNQGKAASCINVVQTDVSPLGEALWGKGVLVACVDSGIDYAHPDFRNADGSTRILKLWDQSIEGSPPQGYRIGTEYTREQINTALQQDSRTARLEVVPSVDVSGHGTAVMGIAAGNGRASQGVYRGVASESDLIVVKLGPSKEGGFPRTTELMQGIDYAVRQGIFYGRPLALNLSFGNNYGSHRGDSLLETYLDQVASQGRNVICVGTGNEGSQATHTSGVLAEGRTEQVSLGVGQYQTGMNVQIWKHYVDEVDIALLSPAGQMIEPVSQQQGLQRFSMGNTEILLYYGEPSPYSISQEIYIDLIPKETYIDSGIWLIRLVPRRIIQGDYQMWLPGGSALVADTRFYLPNPAVTITIPSTAGKVISVGAYNSRQMTYADFSGRGYGTTVQGIKPDLAAPGVNIMTTEVGGGYAAVTGTSFATPFVTGSAALMMEWGILRGNDPFLYGEKVKAYLRRGARQLPGYAPWPNARLGYGVLCLRDSFPV
ncbi:MAG: S8 family peptidase [Lachnospiraceae bacterium]|jgi:minor extracellular serine protease Vpr